MVKESKEEGEKRRENEQQRIAGRLGGAAVAPGNRSFAKDPEAAKAAGRLGGLASAAARARRRQEQQ